MSADPVDDWATCTIWGCKITLGSAALLAACALINVTFGVPWLPVLALLPLITGLILIAVPTAFMVIDTIVADHDHRRR